VPTFSHDIWVYDFRPIFDGIWASFISGYRASNPYSTPTLTTRHGYCAVKWSDTGGGGTADTYYIYAPLPAGQTIPARVLLSKPGFDGLEQVTYNSASGGASQHWGDTRSVWLLSVVALKADILETWCGATVTIDDALQVTTAGNEISNALAIFKISTGAEVMVSTEALYGTNVGIDTGILLNEAALPSVIVGTGNTGVSLGGSALDEINSTLQLIALRDYQISFNHGQTIFSAMGGVITG
jgi:hypothetical protein